MPPPPSRACQDRPSAWRRRRHTGRGVRGSRPGHPEGAGRGRQPRVRASGVEQLGTCGRQPAPQGSRRGAGAGAALDEPPGLGATPSAVIASAAVEPRRMSGSALRRSLSGPVDLDVSCLLHLAGRRHGTDRYRTAAGVGHDRRPVRSDRSDGHRRGTVSPRAAPVWRCRGCATIQSAHAGAFGQAGSRPPVAGARPWVHRAGGEPIRVGCRAGTPAHGRWGRGGRPGRARGSPCGRPGRRPPTAGRRGGRPAGRGSHRRPARARSSATPR